MAITNKAVMTSQEQQSYDQEIVRRHIHSLGEKDSSDMDKWLSTLNTFYDGWKYSSSQRLINVVTHLNVDQKAWYDKNKIEIDGDWTCFCERLKQYASDHKINPVNISTTDSSMVSHTESVMLEELIDTKFNKYSGIGDAKIWLLQTMNKFKETYLVDRIVRFSQIVSNWSRNFTNICSLIRNDKYISDNNNPLAFRIIVDGINLLRCLLGLETNFAIFVNDPLSQFIQGQIKILRNKLSSIPIRLLSNELSSEFQHLRIFKYKTDDNDDDDDDDDTVLVLEGSIYKKTDESNRKSDIDYDDPFAHLKHKEQEKILGKIRKINKERQKLPLSLDSFFSNGPIEGNVLDNEEKSKIRELKVLEQVRLKHQNLLTKDDVENTTGNPKNNSRMLPNSHSKSYPLPQPQTHTSNEHSDVSITDIQVQATLDRIAETNFATRANINSDLTPSKEKIREMLNNTNIYDLYQGGSYHEKQKNPMAVYNTKLEELLNVPSQIWSYQKLASCESINSVIDNICATVRDPLSDMFNKFPNPVVFEWVIMIDNSGSMSIYENYIREALIIILETFRKLECRVAVGRFGNRNATSQAILKPFDLSLTFRVGQMIFDGLSFCESSHIATGIEAIASCVWGQSETPTTVNVKRIALVITDALSKELREDKDQFTETKRAFNFSLAMLHVRSASLGRKMEGLQSLLQLICDNLCISVDPLEPSVKSLNTSTSSLLVLTFQQIIRLIRDSTTISFSKIHDTTGTVCIQPILIQSCEQNKNSDYIWPVEKLIKATTYEDALNNDGSGAIAKSLCFVSPPTNALPYQDVAINLLQQDNKRREMDNNQKGRSDSMEKAKKKLDAELRYIRIKWQENIQQVKQTWQQAQIEQSMLITELSNVIEEYVMPCNTYSRRRADFSGPLYLPGLVKAVATDYTYKRIGSSKTAGGKRQYSIIFAIDTSMSMIGHLEHCAMESLLLLTSALVECGIDNFGIILFGYGVRILKKFDQSWDEVTIYMLLQNFIISETVGTNDAIAIEYTLDMLSQEPASNIKKRLTEALIRADSENIEVIGCQIGFERPCVHRFYRDWIIAAIPAALCDAFRYKYRKDNDGPFPSLSDDNSLLNQRIIQGTADDPQKLLENFQRQFTSIENILNTERDAHLIGGSGGGSMSLDVCFVLDVTGSMTPWLSGIKKQINAITDGITKKIEKEFPDMDFILRYAVVAYRDEGDNHKIEPLEFQNPYVIDGRLTSEKRKTRINKYHEEQTAKVGSFLSKLTAHGGKDEPEDVLGALNYAMSLNWQAKAKFIILVCDAPAHDRECNDIANDRFPNGIENLKVEHITKKLTENNIDLILCHLKKTATKKMAAKLLQCLRQCQPNRANEELLREITLYNSVAQEQNKPYHLVFVLDESGSMSVDGKWDGLVTAYNMFLNKRLEIAQWSGGDIISIIYFNHDARIIHELHQLSSTAPELERNRGGSTSFGPALKAAFKVLGKATNNYIPLLLFMSDGGGIGGPHEMTKIHEAYHSRGLQVHTIAFGRDADKTTLNKIAQAGKGTFHQNITSVDLSDTFVQISTQLTAFDGLIDEFATRVSDAATTKLMLEFL
ncbi:hypothetical protein I4U23_022550 [Adineta vaga]|nr:hypothetical protein I4U23_022550 [Adineta vaga]